MRARTLKLFYGFACMAALVESAGAQEPNRVGIRALTPETYAEAIGDVGTRQILTKDLKFIKNREPFAFHGEDIFLVAIETPYTRAAEAAWEAKRRLQPVPTMTVASLNAGQVLMIVQPGAKITSADSIEAAYIKREGIVIKPLRQAVKPTTARTLLGATRTLTRGEFVFPIAAFEPSKPITVVLVGASQTLEWSIWASQLGEMK